METSILKIATEILEYSQRHSAQPIPSIATECRMIQDFEEFDNLPIIVGTITEAAAMWQRNNP